MQILDTNSYCPNPSQNASFLCQNGGICVNQTSNINNDINFKCACKYGYFGFLCEFSKKKIFSFICLT